MLKLLIASVADAMSVPNQSASDEAPPDDGAAAGFSSEGIAADAGAGAGAGGNATIVGAGSGA